MYNQYNFADLQYVDIHLQIPFCIVAYEPSGGKGKETEKA